MSEKKKVFISGPITGLEDTYRAIFADAAQKVLDAGHIPINPALLPDSMSQRDYMTICASMLATADEILFLPGAERSDGARAECALAVKMGIPQFTLDTWLDRVAPEKETILERWDRDMAAYQARVAAKTQPTPHGGRNERLFGAEAVSQKPEATDTSDQMVSGFLILQCAECGRVKTICTRTPLEHYHCRACGHDTPLRKDAMFMAYATCPTCGKRAWYRTNAGKKNLEVKCIDCKSPVPLELNRRGDTYITADVPGGGHLFGQLELRMTIGG